MYILVRIVKSDDSIETVKVQADSREQAEQSVAEANIGYKEIASAFAPPSIE